MANNYDVKDAASATKTKAALDIGGVLYDKGILYDTSGNAIPFNSNGRAAAASSAPVALSNEDFAAVATNVETKVFDVTLSLDTSAYASGDLLADAQQCDGALAKADGAGILQSIMVIDEDDQKAAFTIYITNVSTSWGTENSAPTITDTVARSILAIVDVAVGDYKDLGGVSVANIKGIGAALKAVSGTDDLYVAVVNGTGTPTYTASGVRLRLGIMQG